MGKKEQDGISVAKTLSEALAASRAKKDSYALSGEFFDQRKKELSKRVGKKRFAHIEGVVETAADIARCYGVDDRKARLAGLLHDWDKGLDDDEVVAKAKRCRIDVPADVLREMPWLLHGPTAAASLGEEYPEIPADVLQAIERHTAGATDMSDLDIVVYVADFIEPGRTHEGVQDLRNVIGEVSLEELFLRTYTQILAFLIERRKRFHPQTAEIWNCYCARWRNADMERDKK